MKPVDGFVRVFHWVAPVLMPLLVIVGRELLGAPSAWVVMIAVFSAPVILVAMYVLPVITLFDLDAKAARRARFGYSVASYVLWVSFVGIMLTMADGAGEVPVGSVLTTWGVPMPVSSALFVAFLVVGVTAYATALVLTIIGVARSRSPQTAPVAR